jgi:putative two-component system response regulator
MLVNVYRTRIAARWLWLLALASAQMICLLAALTWYGHLLHKGLTVALRGQIAAVNAQVVGELAEFISQWRIDDVRPGSADWTRLQALVERMKLPNEGYVSVIDSRSGAVVCRPRQPEEQGTSPIDADMQLVEKSLGTVRPDATLSGWVEMPDGTHYVTIRDVPTAGVLLVASQREGGLWAAVSYVSDPLWSFGVFVVVVLVLLGTMFSMLIIHRYENTLEGINSHLEKIVVQRSRALVNTRDAVIFGLANLADSRDPDTGQHVDRVREYIGILAEQLATTNKDIDEEYIERLKLASSLHDIGKVGIRDEILLKPGKLTAQERKIMQTHGEIGARCLAAIQQRLGEDDFLEMACEIAASHHERWDGLGYPFGLQGDEIPLSARIVAVADVYDALTTQRVYRGAMSHREATKLIFDGAGTQFDPAVVAAFRACMDRIKQVADQFNSQMPPDRQSGTERTVPVEVTA